MSDMQTGVILLNTGSPVSLEKKSVKAFISSILSDPCVMGRPKWLMPLVIKGLIAPTRCGLSFKRYQLIWGDQQESPLLKHMLALQASLTERLQLPVACVMRYGSPSAEQALQQLKQHAPSIKRVIVLPLFPQYAWSSYATSVDYLTEEMERLDPSLSVEVISPYYNHPAYIEALVSQLRGSFSTASDHLVFNFHSLPMRHIQKGKEQGVDYDYEHQSVETARLTAEALDLRRDQYTIGYASSFGRGWLKPYLWPMIERLPSTGVKRVAVISPGFIVDNLETLYDINLRAKSLFLEKGGEHFSFVSCLNGDFGGAAATLISEKL